MRPVQIDHRPQLCSIRSLVIPPLPLDTYQAKISTLELSKNRKDWAQRSI